MRAVALFVAAAFVAAGLDFVVAPSVAPGAAAATAPAAGEYVPLSAPVRIVDSRSGLGLSGPVTAGVTSSFQVTGLGGIPASVSTVAAVSMTVTAVSPSADSWMTVWAAGAARPGATSLIVNKSITVANTLITKVGSTGKVSVTMGTGSTAFMVEVQGYYTSSSATGSAATFVPLTLSRIYDTRNGTGGGVSPMPGATTLKVPVAGRGGVPASGVAGVVVNVTSVNASGYLVLEVWDGTGSVPSGSALNVQSAGLAVGAMVQTGLAPDGTIGVRNVGGSTTDLIVDVEGYYLPPSADGQSYYVPVDPTRIVDTRSGLNTGGKTTPVAGGGTLSVPIRGVTVSGAAVVPASKNVIAVMLTVTMNAPTANGFLTVFPEGVARPVGSQQNYTAGTQHNVTASVLAKVGASGRISVYLSGSTQVLVDVQGYFATTPAAAPPAPAVSSTAFSSGSWAASGATGTVTVSASGATGEPAVDRYDWTLDDPTLAVPNRVNVSANTAGTIHLSGANAPEDGWHTLYVRAGNTAGNVSAVRSYTFGVGAAITSPGDGTRVTRYVRLNGKAASSFGSVTWNYRRSTADAWTAIPASDVTQSGTGVSWPVTTTTNGATTTAPELVWDAGATLGADGSVVVQACYTPTGGGNAVCTADSADPTITLDRLDVGNTDASTDLAGGSVDLLTGNYTVSQTDASVSAPGDDLAVSRTFNSLDPTRTTNAATGTVSVFGPGWTTALAAGSASADWTGLSDRGSTITVVDADGATVTFAKTSAGAYEPTGDDADSGLAVTAGTPASNGPATYTVSDLDGNATTFAAQGSFGADATPAAPHAYQVSTVTQPGSAQTTTYTYDITNRPVQILAPVPAGSTCTSTALGSGTWTGGCKALYLTYGTSGDAAGRLTAVTVRTTDSSGSELDVDVACYAYDASSDHRLAAVWDPRDGTAGTGAHPLTCADQVRPTTYTYDSAGRIATITPPGLAAWTLGYDANGRLATVSRTHSTSFNNGATEKTEVVYGVAVSPDGAHPEYRPDLSGTAVATWGQADAPVTATAVFGPGHAASTGDLRGASVSYLNAEGRTVNTADYAAPGGVQGAAGWNIDTTDYDSHGNVVRTLTAGNRDEALDPTNQADPALGLPTNTVAAAAALSTVNVYAYDPATGISDLTDTFGPLHLVTLANGTGTPARAHTHTTYDDGTETAHPTGGLLHLPVTVTTGASLSAQPVATNETDVRTTTNTYALSTTDATGWTFRKPMKVTTDLGGGTSIATITRYAAATGDVIESRQPRSAGGDAAATLSVYYTAGTNSADPGCGNKPAWAGLLCQTTPAAQPGIAGLPGLVTKQITSYDYLARPTTVVESVTDAAGTQQTRTTTTTYTTSGYGTDPAATTVAGGLGTAVPATSITYDPATGLATRTTAAATATQAATSATTAYDDFGRVITYTDNDQATGAQANNTTTSYADTTGLVTSITDAHGTTSYTYNQNGETRDKPTTMNVTGAGAFTGTYDADGDLATQTWPNGLTQTITKDETGDTTALSATGGGRSWLAEQQSSNIHGQAVTDNYTGTSNYGGRRTYTYDLAGRLTTTNDTLAATSACTTRTYGFDADGNRTASAVYNPASSGACQTTTPASSLTHAYDLADRLQNTGTDTGLAYDAFGRITTLPSADTGNAGGNTTLGYYTNDLARTQTQGSTTLTYTLDAHLRLAAHTSNAGGSWTNHYRDPSGDSPAWIAENPAATTWTRNITDLTGNLAATIDQTGTLTWQITNLHGDVVATAASADTEPSTYYLTDEYGLTVTGYTTGSRYGWLGGKQRAHDTLAGLTLMGVRLYTPTLGRFLSTDPVVGGSASAYAYPNDPVNSFDLDGRRWGFRRSWIRRLCYVGATGSCFLSTRGTFTLSLNSPFTSGSASFTMYGWRPRLYGGVGYAHGRALTRWSKVGASFGWSPGRPNPRTTIAYGGAGCYRLCVGAQKGMIGRHTFHGWSPYVGFGAGWSSWATYSPAAWTSRRGL